MEIEGKLKAIDQLKSKIDGYGKLPPEVLRKINYKFRLDWNYYSNNMEGNTLTKDETRSIMIGNITIHGKPIRDVLEMRGHDDAITEILKIGKGELNLSEKRIKDIHRAIMHEETEENKAKIGNWKKVDNYILNYKDERFDFVKPEDVAEEMHKLINWLSAENEKQGKKSDLHPSLLAIEFHLRYLTIHPFYDGNGRTARILMNLILISKGYPPIIIKSDDKVKYYQYLADIQGYSGSKDFYYSLMLDLLIRSLELVDTAINGGDIEESTDIDKKLTLLERELEAVDPNEEIKKNFSKETLFEIFDSWGSELLNRLIPAIQKFNRFFTGTQHWVSIQNGLGSRQFIDEPASEVIETLRKDLSQNAGRANYHDVKIVLTAFYGTFKKGGLNTFGCTYGLEIRFDHIKYEVWVDNFSETNQRKQEMWYEKLLHKPLSDTEIMKLTKHLEDVIYQHIDYHTKKSGLR